MSFHYPPPPKQITFAEFRQVHPFRVRVGGEWRYHTNYSVCEKYASSEPIEWFDGVKWQEMQNWAVPA